MTGKISGTAKPTIGADFSKKETIIDNQNVTLQVWDTAGQEKFQSLGYAFYRGADCCMLVYDITNRKSFEALQKWRDGFVENAGPEDVKNYPFLLLGNKLDREGERQVTAAEGQDWARSHNNILFFETSAKEGHTVEEAFIEVGRKGVKRMESTSFSMPGSLSGAPGAIKLNANLAADDDAGTGTNRRGATKNSANCGC